jgi:fructose-specific component phosphotransferase system IIB-like protein
MVLPHEKQRTILPILASFSIATFLAGCADTPSTATKQEVPIIQQPDMNQDTVVGQGTAQDRNAINASNQRMFDAEHAESPPEITTSVAPAASAPPATPAQTPAGTPQ